jgi:hypothetical protein
LRALLPRRGGQNPAESGYARSRRTLLIRPCDNSTGLCVEIGCAAGRTTVFLRKFMDENNIVKDYYALDTFSGFVPEHVDYEVARRDKNRAMSQIFVTNKRDGSTTR